jgi:positive phototaxis protein PixI
MTTVSAVLEKIIGQNDHSFLCLSLNAKTQVLLAAHYLTEISTLKANQIVPIPDVMPQVMGVCDWRGEVLWLIDLAYLLRYKPLCRLGHRQSDYPTLIIHHDGCHMGFVVQKIHQIQRYEAQTILPASALLPPGVPRLNEVKGYLDTADQRLPILDCDALLRRVRSGA